MLIYLTSHYSLLTTNPGSSACTWLCTDVHGGAVLNLLPHLHSDALVATECCKDFFV